MVDPLPQWGGGTSGGGMANPFPMLNQMTEFQRNQMGLLQFQTQFMANRALGEVIANHGSVDAAMPEIMNNPLLWGFAQEGIQNALRARGSELSNASVRAGMVNSGFGAAVQMTLNSMSNPTPENIQKNFNIGLQSVPPEVRGDVAGMGKAWLNGLTSLLAGVDQSTPEGAQKARDITKSYLIAGSSVTGHSTEDWIEKPVVGPTGAPVRPLPRQPSGFTGGTGIGQPPPSAPTVPGGPTEVTTSAPVGPDFKPMTLGGVNPTSYDGKKLFGDDTRFVPAGISTPYGGYAGLHAFYPGALEENKKANDEFISPKEFDRYTGAQNTDAMIDTVEADISNLARAGGWTTPGAGNQLRGTLEKAALLIQQMTGRAVDPEELQKMASWESLGKYNKQLGMQLVQSYEGNAKQAVQTIMTGISAVPGLENTPMGGMLLGESIRAMAKWEMDKHEFMNEWRSQRYPQGNLGGALEEFNRQHPPSGYMAAALDKMGMGPSGKFSSPDQIDDLYRKGMFGPIKDDSTTEVYRKLLKNQFPAYYNKLIGKK